MRVHPCGIWDVLFVCPPMGVPHCHYCILYSRVQFMGIHYPHTAIISAILHGLFPNHAPSSYLPTVITISKIDMKDN